MSGPSLSVVIVTYQSSSTLRRCVESVLSNTTTRFELIVVDNASTDAGPAYLEALQRKRTLHFCQNEKNLGYSAAANIGIQQSKGEYVILLNPDTEVYPGWELPLLRALEDPAVGASGPMSDAVSGRQFVGFESPPPSLHPSELDSLLKRHCRDTMVDTKLLMGFCLATRRDVLNHVGSLDEEMVLGADDLEFSWRLRLAGYELRICRGSFVKHHAGVSFQALEPSEKSKLIRQSDLALYRKLEQWYGVGSVPSSEELFGSPIFHHILIAAANRNEGDTSLQASIICHDDHYYLKSVLLSLKSVPTNVFVNKVPWNDGDPGDWKKTRDIAHEHGATVICGEWRDEAAHRTAVLEHAIQNGIENLIIPDSDEILSSSLLSSLIKIAQVNLADVVHCSMDTYWKSPEYVIRPRERLLPVIMIRPAEVRYEFIREFRGQRPLLLSPEQGVLHHLSYSGPDERVLRKVSTWSHKDELVPNWLQSVWYPWERDRTGSRLHPTHPDAYGYAERVPLSLELQSAWQEYLNACGGQDPLRPGSEEFQRTSWPKVSVIIPLYGGENELRQCLGSLDMCRDLIYETIVVDDCSPDLSPFTVRNFEGTILISHDSNGGFSKACNTGAGYASGDVLLFLNSDTLVPRASLIRLVESLLESGTIAAAGPVSNFAGHFQQVAVTYSKLETLDLFAEDWCMRSIEPTEVDMLVGFCLAVRRSAWDEVGPFDESFRVGMFEDNDFSYRLRRSGYRLIVVPNSFVHHHGNASLDRHTENKATLFNENHARFRKKWNFDIESGYASHLSGLSAERIRFDSSRKPELLIRSRATAVQQADISLCMIVRNEERVLADCLRSALPFFKEVVVVDTGSTDSTIAIARSFGANVIEIEWPQSFAEARNVSLSAATGRWICWLDADDTLPFSSGEAILQAVLGAPNHVGGLVIPVRFVNDDPVFGTTVDHVKVFRNLSGIRFEGRIHEQVLPSIRELGLEVVRIDAEVLHSGYDTSEEGQARKRERDNTLLELDLRDRPGHPFVLFNLGMTAHFNGDHHKAIDWLEQSIAVAQDGESHIRKAFALWAVSLKELNLWDDALAIVERGLVTVGKDPELLFQQALIETSRGNLREARQIYAEVLKLDSSCYFSSLDNGIFGFKTLHNLGAVCLQLGETEEAKSFFKKASESNPRFLNSTFELFRLCIDTSDISGAYACIHHVIAVEGEGPNVKLMRKDLDSFLNTRTRSWLPGLSGGSEIADNGHPVH